MNLEIEIARYPNVQLCLAGESRAHPCYKIVQSQQTVDPLKHQVPEAWRGQLRSAPILFLSSNPSISLTEEYPQSQRPDELIADCFNNAFTGGQRPWVKDGKYVLLRSGGHSPNWVRFWASMLRRATELLGREAKPGVDFAMTELVHCKSRDELGVPAALSVCATRYLNQILNASPARVVVVVGKKAARQLANVLSLSATEGIIRAEGHFGQRFFAFIPHPDERGVRKALEYCLTPADLSTLKAALT